MGGLRRSLPVTFWTFLMGTLAIAGIPGFAGFFSKDEILWEAFGYDNPHGLGGPWLWAIGVVVAALTAFYMFRLVFLCFYGHGRMHRETAHHLHESPRVMTVPLMILAVLSVVGGWVGIPRSLTGGSNLNAFERFLAPAFRAEHSHEVERVGQGQALEIMLMVLALGAVLIGSAFAWRYYRSHPEIPGELERKLPNLARLLANKYYVDEMYDAWIVQPYWKLCAALDAFDRKFVDGLVNAAGALTEVLAQVLKLFQTGQVRRYALWFMLGAIAILWYLV
jgi:NADH-quinone oxidoreductase subunit L